MLRTVALIFCFSLTSCAQTQSPLAQWLDKAEQGDADAQFWLGVAYEGGRGTKQDLPEALKWLRKSATQGNPDAQNLLGQIYENGKGVPRDYLKSAEWYRAACGHRPDYGGAGQGCNNLGLLYFDGSGVKRDMVEAYKYFKLAGVRRNIDAASSRMTAAQIDQAERKTGEWIEAHPEQ